MRYGVYFTSGKAEIFESQEIIPVREWIYLVSRVDGVLVTDAFVKASDIIYIKRMPEGSSPPVEAPQVPATVMHARPDRPRAEQLTDRQRHIMRLRAQDLPLTEIAKRLDISESGVDNAIKGIKTTFGITERHAFLALCREWYPPQHLEQGFVSS